MASSSYSNRSCKYDVFLSFRGEDTRYSFTSFLLNDLRRSSIVTFKDDDELEKGEEIAPALLTAIEESRAAVIVFSKNYATSSWCLDELAKIMECHENHGQMVVPVFYDVDPSHVRNHLGSFGDAPAAHEKDPKKSVKVQKWKAALRKAANIAGHSTNEIRDKAKLVNEIVGDILKKLMPFKLLQSVKGLVGIDSRIEEVKRLLLSGSLDVCVLGIWGMAGIGKTTIAKVVFEQIAWQFEGSYFLNNVREKSEKSGGLDSLVEETLSGVLGKGINYVGTSAVMSMLCRKKVLIVLDDVSNLAQMRSLAGDRSWFGAGSKILLTSRDKQVLKNFVDHTYKVEGLNYADALQLFSLNAFKLEKPPEDWTYLCNSVLQYGKGNPLSLQVLGSSLFGKNRGVWESTLNRLEKGLDRRIQEVLKISYDGLEDEEKDIFLHIACFFKGKNQDHVIQILDGCDLSTKTGIDTLIDKALINISNDHLEMHDLLQEMGRSIVRQESKEPGKRSRLWSHEDICAVLNKNSGTEAIEGIFLDMSKLTTDLYLNPKAFSEMPKLKLLRFYRPYEDFRVESKVNLSQGLESLPTDLRYLHWYGYPLPSLPTNFDPVNLVELHLQYSSIKQLWEGTKDLRRLKEINLNFSELLIEAPDLSRAPDLRTITCRGCYKLEQLPLTAVHERPSCLSFLTSLTHLYFSHCKNIRSFPDGVDLPSLEVLNLSYCSALEQFPLVSRNIKSLHLSGTAIRELPSSIKFLTKLDFLNLDHCDRLKSLPSSICKLKSLEILSLTRCSNFDDFPEILETMDNLIYLFLDGTAIVNLPESLGNLESLEFLYINNCSKLEKLPENIKSLEQLHSLRAWGGNLSTLTNGLICLSSITILDLSGSNFERLPTDINRLSMLICLNVSDCKSLQSLPELPLSLKEIEASDCVSLKTVSAINPMSRLGKLEFANCFKLDQNSWSDNMANVKLMMIQHPLYADDDPTLLTVYYPGSGIPRWFKYQSVGSSINIQLPQYWNISGFALCTVFQIKCSGIWNNFNRLLCMRCKVHFGISDGNNENHIRTSMDLTPWGFLRPRIGAEHLLIWYDGHFWDCMKSCCSEFSFEFTVRTYEAVENLVEVIKCGVFPIYAHDEGEANPEITAKEADEEARENKRCKYDGYFNEEDDQRSKVERNRLHR